MPLIYRVAPAFALIASSIWAAPLAWAQGDDDRYYRYHMWDGGWGMFFGPLTMIVLIAAIIVVAVLIVRWAGGAGQAGAAPPAPGKAPIDILKERFARGEIDKDEFEERRRLLE